MKKAPLLLLIICLVIAVVIAWFWYPIRSMAVMSVYSAVHSGKSIMADNDFKIAIPGGTATPDRDWYPFVMTFNSDGFRARGGEIKGMSILYNFPAFDFNTRTNLIYDTDSPYNSSFYGAYVVESSNSIPFGYSENGEVNFDEILSAFKYDYVNLVLDDLGDKNFDFDVETKTATRTNYIGYGGWTKVNAKVLTNSTSHIYAGFRRNYLQYGPPPKSVREHFPGIYTYGRLYIRYFTEYDCTVIMYVMSPDMDVIKDCDENLLSNSKIIDRK